MKGRERMDLLNSLVNNFSWLSWLIGILKRVVTIMTFVFTLMVFYDYGLCCIDQKTF